MASSSVNLWVLLSLGFAGILFMTRKLKKTIKEDFGAFVEKFQLLPPSQPAPPKAPHPLTGLTFAVSDVFDIEGHVTGFGNPDWGRTHDAASQTAPVVSALVEGGATCTGKTVVDEMAFSLSGENKHYGAPTNPASPACIPGGSSSGAAVAVAIDIVDFSLGIDSSGGVRVPAAFCGIIGFRASYGAVPHVGIIPVSRSLDTVGLLAKDPNVLRRVGHVMLQLPFATQRSPRKIIIADDCFELSKTPSDRAAQAVIKSTEKLFGSLILKHEKLEEYLNSKVPGIKAFSSKKENGVVRTSSSIRSLASIMDIIKRHEFRQNHKEWVNLVKPELDPSISTKIYETVEMSDKEIDNLLSVRHEVRSAINSLLQDDGILVVPTTMESLPPKLGAKEVLSEDYQSRVFSLLSIASMAGCCQVSVPLGFSHKFPVSVSFIARHGGDRFLLDTVNTMYKTLQEQTEITATTKTLSNGLSPEQSAEIAKEKGNQAYKDKQWQKAISCYTDAIKLNGNSATYYSNRAAVYLETGSFVQAEADCSKAINLDKKNVKAYLRRGTAREMLGFYKEAIEDFGYALVLEPTNKRASLSAQRLKKLFQ